MTSNHLKLQQQRAVQLLSAFNIRSASRCLTVCARLYCGFCLATSTRNTLSSAHTCGQCTTGQGKQNCSFFVMREMNSYYTDSCITDPNLTTKWEEKHPKPSTNGPNTRPREARNSQPLVAMTRLPLTLLPRELTYMPLLNLPDLMGFLLPHSSPGYDGIFQENPYNERKMLRRMPWPAGAKELGSGACSSCRLPVAPEPAKCGKKGAEFLGSKK